jgi:RecB family exonuclease
VIASRNRPTLPRLQAADLQAAFAGHRSVYSISELETYGRCPFQYLLANVLALRPEHEGEDARIQGTLLHDVIRRCFRRRRARATREPAPTTPPLDLRSDLRRHLEEALSRQKSDISPHRLRMTQRLLFDAIDGLAEREERFTAQFGLTPSHFELSFGFVPGFEETWEEERDGPTSRNAHDAASCSEPLLLMPTDDGPPVAVSGTIDRVDLDAGGRRALVLDYKLGRPPQWPEIQRGASLQMPLYLLALERLFGKVGAVACYDSMRERGRRRFHRTEHVNVRQFGPILPLEDGSSVTPVNRDQFNDLIRVAETTAVRLARAISQARIEATPGDHCRTCAYGDVCRTTLAGHDGESAL